MAIIDEIHASKGLREVPKILFTEDNVPDYLPTPESSLDKYTGVYVLVKGIEVPYVAWMYTKFYLEQRTLDFTRWVRNSLFIIAKDDEDFVKMFTDNELCVARDLAILYRLLEGSLTIHSLFAHRMSRKSPELRACTQLINDLTLKLDVLSKDKNTDKNVVNDELYSIRHRIGQLKKKMEELKDSNQNYLSVLKWWKNQLPAHNDETHLTFIAYTGKYPSTILERKLIPGLRIADESTCLGVMEVIAQAKREKASSVTTYNKIVDPTIQFALQQIDVKTVQSINDLVFYQPQLQFERHFFHHQLNVWYHKFYVLHPEKQMWRLVFPLDYYYNQFPEVAYGTATDYVSYSSLDVLMDLLFRDISLTADDPFVSYPNNKEGNFPSLLLTPRKIVGHFIEEKIFYHTLKNKSRRQEMRDVVLIPNFDHSFLDNLYHVDYPGIHTSVAGKIAQQFYLLKYYSDRLTHDALEEGLFNQMLRDEGLYRGD